MDFIDTLDALIEKFPDGWRESLKRMPNFIRYNLQEIRVRFKTPVMLCTGRENFIFTKDGQVSKTLLSKMQGFTAQEIKEVFDRLSDYSVHSYQEELKKGFFTLENGCRVGIGGTFLSEQGRVVGVRDITSLNIRIAKEIVGAADELISVLRRENFPSVLLAGPPSTGKTTMLRDLARQLSNGVCGKFLKVSLIDERGELAAGYRQKEGASVGISTDVYSFCPKAKGIEMALRTGSPDFLICDELGGEEETSLLLEGLSSGVKIAASVHGESLKDLMEKKSVKTLLSAGVFEKIVFLKRDTHPGEVKEIVSMAERKRENKDGENSLGDLGNLSLQFSRDLPKLPPEKTGDIVKREHPFNRTDKDLSFL